MQINYVNYLKTYVIKETVPYETVKEKIEVMYLDGNITNAEHDELMALADQVCSPFADLPENEARITAIEQDLQTIKERLGMVSSELWPLVKVKKFTSSADFKHTGDRVSVLMEGETQVRHYVCKLTNNWEEQGTAYSPLGNLSPWKEFPLDASEEEISAFIEEWKAKYPDFTGWVR